MAVRYYQGHFYHRRKNTQNNDNIRRVIKADIPARVTTSPLSAAAPSTARSMVCTPLRGLPNGGIMHREKQYIPSSFAVVREKVDMMQIIN